MKIITKYDCETQAEIDNLQNRISEIEMEYADKIDKARLVIEMERIARDYKRDLRIIALQKRICEIITYAVPKIIVMEEN